jgi:hypothetical protein
MPFIVALRLRSVHSRLCPSPPHRLAIAPALLPAGEKRQEAAFCLNQANWKRLLMQRVGEALPLLPTGEKVAAAG